MKRFRKMIQILIVSFIKYLPWFDVIYPFGMSFLY